MIDPKNLKRDYWQILQTNSDMATHVDRLLGHLYASNATLSVCAPFDRSAGDALVGREAIKQHFFAPLLASFSGLERRTDILLQGQFKGGDWLASYGWLVGRFDRPFFGLKPTSRFHWLRFGWFERVEQGQVVESIVLLDIARLLIECGAWPLRAQLGETWSPVPRTQDGLGLVGIDPTEGDKSLKLVEAMIAGLMRYDGKSLKSMGMTQFWTPEFYWYGPGGIGSARGHHNYEQTHQRPFLTAFPDRIGGNHRCRIGEGTYVASSGWPSINATHAGDGWLGLSATGKRITMRVMDFWRRDGDFLDENWVFIDMVDLLKQFGIDLFADLGASAEPRGTQ
ncbi:hypothetical protein PbB2_01617 [Candidatus Phycosocius bacilliformis]|uniref:SnoaL-like domain-containing protein n=1 Tax=Candidatus Phycosocius bacilliformis TaxID=1445552 RepID=A0A2P2EA54_9PROT|nr:ester cyclase [Candidatus Phycosocius bacilliformis]GBF57946.1 hypothetical protein PbB2_01617 [Candidatus Phycosocius bacilliformis]